MLEDSGVGVLFETVSDRTTTIGGHVPHTRSRVAVGIMAHNEEANVRECLEAVLTESGASIEITAIVVVASGCTDRTESIVRRIAEADARVRLIVEQTRTGKASAINLFLRDTLEPLVVVLGGDVVICAGTIERLCGPLLDPLIGMTGARPVPTNRRVGLVGHAVNIVWDLHHEVSTLRPKLGEAVAFKRIYGIKADTSVDEALLEHVITSQGMLLQYVQDAVIRNHGPETLGEFMNQRRRIHAGHLALAAQTGYRVSSMGIRQTSTAVITLWRRGEGRRYLVATILLEALARCLAHIRWRHTPAAWKPLVTSKRVIKDGQILRAHHDRRQKIVILAAGPTVRRTESALMVRLRSVIRAEDRIGISGGNIIVSFRGDEDSANALMQRLSGEVTTIDQMPCPLDVPQTSFQ